MEVKALYVSALQQSAGSLIVTMGLMRLLKSKYQKVGFYRPIITTKASEDNDINFIVNYFLKDEDYQEAYSFSTDEVITMVSEGKKDHFIQEVIKTYNSFKHKYDFVLIEGYYRSRFEAIFDFDINLELAKNLGTPLVAVLNGKNKSAYMMHEQLHIIDQSIERAGCDRFATFVNRLDDNEVEKLNGMIKDDCGHCDVFVLPEVDELDRTTINGVKAELKAEYIFGTDDQLEHSIRSIKVGSMQINNFLEHIEDNQLLIFSGDRDELILACIASFYARNMPSIAGIVLTGNIKPSPKVMELLNNLEEIPLPILAVKEDTYTTSRLVEKISARIRPNNSRKISLAFGLFNQNVAQEMIVEKLKIDKKELITPIMFEYSLFERARADKQTIVLPESHDDRILRAAEALLAEDVVHIILLGSPVEIKHKASILGLDISKAKIIDIHDHEYMERFANDFFELRKHKGITIEMAKEHMSEYNYFGTMMVKEGLADGMVSGATHTTAETVRPALQIIKTKPGISIVSSVFFMCLDTKVLAYGDCAINQNPDKDQLAEIAITSADTARAFGLEPKVAMLSYSSGTSGTGEDVDKVRSATEIAKSKRSDLLLDGPLQYDAATVPSVAKKKMPDSKVAGFANVLIFPDLNTGNNTYKAVQRSSGAIAIGPVLQGLRKPVNDLSRGCLVKDIVNTVAITAIQAQQVKQNENTGN